MLPFFATLLGLPTPAAPDAALALTSQRQQTLEALQGLVLQLAAQQPVLMIIEDLHWADPSTLEALELLLGQASTARLLVVLTARPDSRVPWGGPAPVTWLTLTRLRRAQVERLVTAVTSGRALPSEVVEQVARKTDGVPLFVEELTKMVVESGLVREGAAGYELAGPLPPLAIPTTLQDSLMARLDRLTTTKVVAQLAASGPARPGMLGQSGGHRPPGEGDATARHAPRDSRAGRAGAQTPDSPGGGAADPPRAMAHPRSRRPTRAHASSPSVEGTRHKSSRRCSACGARPSWSRDCTRAGSSPSSSWNWGNVPRSQASSRWPTLPWA